MSSDTPIKRAKSKEDNMHYLLRFLLYLKGSGVAYGVAFGEICKSDKKLALDNFIYMQR